MTTATKQLRIKIIQDTDPEKPRWDPVTTFVTWNRRYTIGDEQPKSDPLDYMLEQLPAEDQDAFYEWWEAYPENHTSTWDAYYREREAEKAKWIGDKFDQYFHYLPVFAYDHGGITISTGRFSCPWDSGQLGFIYISKEKAEKEFGGDPTDLMRSEIELYDQYLQGYVWGFRIFEVQTCNLGHEHEEEIESCWGFYGDELEETGIWDDVSGSGITKEQLEQAWENRW